MNYNLSIEIGKIPGARIKDVDGKNGPRTCVVIPIDNERGMCVDAYEKFDHKLGGKVWVPLRSARLNLQVLESRDVRIGTHYVKPSFSREFYRSIAEEDKKNIPIVGNMKEMPSSGKSEQGSGNRIDNSEDW